MRTIEAIERELDDAPAGAPPEIAAARLLSLAEEVLETWLLARDEEPTRGEREGLRLLALHHQGARGTPSFNACRETCREIAYHYNLLCAAPPGAPVAAPLEMTRMLVRHLALFVGGKMQVEGLGDFCCASRPLRAASATMADE